jgi:hypothetical protein
MSHEMDYLFINLNVCLKNINVIFFFFYAIIGSNESRAFEESGSGS